MKKNYRKGGVGGMVGFGVMAIIGIIVVLQCDFAGESKKPKQPNSSDDRGLVQQDDSGSVTLPKSPQVESTIVVSAPLHLPSGDSEWIELRPGQITSGYTLDPGGSLAFNGTKITEPIPVTYSSDGSILYARRAFLSPASPDGRYAFLKACDGDDEFALCWGLYLIDAQARLLRKTFAGKYGPDKQVDWAADGRHAMFRYRNEGETHWYRIELPSGNSIYLK